MSRHEKINYLEFPASNLQACKEFFSKAFAWTFTDYGPEYTAFSSSEAGLDGGFFKSDQYVSTQRGSALVVFYSDDLESTQATVIKCGGTIVQEIFSFPGGRRFHFADPCGNEFAVWTETD